MAIDQPEFAQQFEAAASHLMKLISDADWRQEQMKRQPSQLPMAQQPPPPVRLVLLLPTAPASLS